MSKTIDKIKYAKSQTDIVEVISRFVTLKKNGANWVGLSPFCDERTPSFTVSKVKNIFKCYSSGKGGDIFDFLKAHKGMDSGAALDYLAVDQPSELPPYVAPLPVPISYTDRTVMFSTLRNYDRNDFATFLFSKFGLQSIKALADYRVGTSKHWPGACIFWYCDIQDRVRSGKIMGYNHETGKRIKEPVPLITWVHKVRKQVDYNLSICLFGEHLLSRTGSVHIFESEKTAIVASLCYPEWVCLASGSLTNLTFERCEVLKGRDVTLHPDVGAEDRWLEKMLQLQGLISADWWLIPLESTIKGYDFCDYLLDQKKV